MQVSTTPYHLCDYHMVHFRDAEGLFPYLNSRPVSLFSARKIHYQIFSPLSLRPSYVVPPSKPSHSKRPPSDQQTK